jgi:hypothetical protein
VVVDGFVISLRYLSKQLTRIFKSRKFPKLQSLTTCTKGSDVFDAINTVVSEFTLFEKCTGIVTDGPKLIVVSKTGLVGHIKQLGVKCVFLHRIVHQEALCGKIIKLNQTMKMVLNLVNLIHGGNKPQRHRAFLTFLEEIDADYGNIPLHSDIRWLSVGNCLQCFFFR